MINLIQTVPPIEVSLGWIDIISLVAGIASLVLSILAIWLSITFYKMSNESSQEMNEASNNINNNVVKLEKLFDTMYSDTFGLVKDNVEHMRRQVDKGGSIDITEEVQRKTEEVVSETLSDIKKENLSKSEVKVLVMDLLKKSKETEIVVQTKTIREEIVDYLKNNGSTSYIRLRKNLLKDYNGEKGYLIFNDAVLALANDGVIEDPYTRIDGGAFINPEVTLKLKV